MAESVDASARSHIEKAAVLLREERPVLARTLFDLLSQFERPEPGYAKTPREAFDSIMTSADTMVEDVQSEARQARMRRD